MIHKKGHRTWWTRTSVVAVSSNSSAFGKTLQRGVEHLVTWNIVGAQLCASFSYENQNQKKFTKMCIRKKVKEKKEGYKMLYM